MKNSFNCLIDLGIMVMNTLKREFKEKESYELLIYTTGLLNEIVNIEISEKTNGRWIAKTNFKEKDNVINIQMFDSSLIPKAKETLKIFENSINFI